MSDTPTPAAGERDGAERWREAAGHYRLLFDATPIPCVVTDGRGAITEANEAAVTLLAPATGRLRQRPLAAVVHEHHRATLEHLLGRLDRAGAVRDWPIRLVDDRGQPIGALLSANAIRVTHGAVTAICWQFVRPLSQLA